MSLVLIGLCVTSSGMCIFILETFLGNNQLTSEIQILGLLVSFSALIVVMIIVGSKLSNYILDEKQ